MFFKEGVGFLDIIDRCNLSVDFCDQYSSSTAIERDLVYKALNAGWGNIHKVIAPHKPGGSAWVGYRPRGGHGGGRYYKIPEFLDFTFGEY